MKRRTFVLGGAMTAACRRGPRLNVYNWSDYIGPETIPQFEREFGVQIHYGTYESNQEMLAQVLSGNSGWDVVFPSGDFIAPMRALGLLAPLDHALLPNLSALAPEFQHPPWDRELSWAIPYMHGVTGILYQRSLQPPPASWADLWERRLQGRLTMLDDEAEVLGVCLKKLGHSLNSGDRGELLAAKGEALAQKPLLRAYLNAEVRDQMVAGDVLAAQAWAVTARQAIAAAPDKLAFAFPREGFPRYADNVAILRESRRAEAAHRWIDYLLRPEVAAGIAMATHTASANGHLPAEVREDSVLYPAAELLARGEWLEAQSAASQKVRDRFWTEIKSS
ncbi:MAG: spermidine/putrescine ABC transporter substrate-binding protein [Acidobacteriota bacterium]|nr:spermidine/putrescine ABC transporter substrate-binding protein [Acidobacteriota bacterium]